MKAKIIKTGEIVEVLSYSKEDSHILYVDKNGKEQFGFNFEIIPDKKVIDWEERRYEIAKDILCAFESNPNENMFVGNPDTQVRNAIMFADELIKQLKNNE